MTPNNDVFATRVYVVGEVLVSLTALLGSMYLLVYGPDQSVKLVASGVISAVTVFWFQRRATEQASNQMAYLANGKLTEMLNNQSALTSRMDNVVSLAAQASKVEKSP